MNGWQSEIGTVGNYTKDVAQKEQYLTNTTTLGQVLYQTVEGLDNGTYSVELYANASYTAGRGFASAALNGELGRAVVYAGDVEKTIPVVHQTAVGENNIVVLENVVVSDGTLKMGLRKDIEGSNWHTIQIKALTQTSNKANADAAAQDEYWKGIAATVAAYEAYANVAGVEKAAIAAAETKAAAQAAIAAFYAAKEAYDALAEIIAKAKTVEFDVTEAEELMASAEATAAQVAAKTAELVHPVNLAVNTKAVEGASAENPITTNFVVNGTFDNQGVVSPWKATGGYQNQTTANNQSGAFGIENSYFYENWNGSAKVNKMYQEIEDIPNGKYTLKIAAFVQTLANPNESQYVFANSDKTYLTVGEPTAYEVQTIVTNNKIEIGLEQTTATSQWMGIDNVSLVYYGDTNIDELVAAYEAALAAAKAVEGDMNAEVKQALDAAIAANENLDKTNADALGAATDALKEATANAQASIAAYATAATILPKMKELTEQTNVYTEEALESYYGQWIAKYEAKTLTTTEANALQDPFLGTGWHASVTVDNFLLSAWDTNPDFQDAPYYINTWSTEGNTDGSEFKVPFFEYWTGDGESLGEKVLTATMNNVEAGEYDVTALVRVRIKNGAEAPAYGIALQANEGEAVNASDGEQVGTSQFYLKEVTATGTVAEDGVLKIQFVVAADNNISWLSFKNVKFEKKAAPEPGDTYAINVAPTANGQVQVDKAEAAEGETVTVTVTPNEGYKVDEAYWSYGDTKTEFEEPEEGNTVSFTMPAAAVTVTVTFKPDVIDYVFVPSEWPAGDPGRISAENVTADDEAGTITVQQTGDNNVALNFKTNKFYEVKAAYRYFYIKATGLSTEEGKSYLWWLNATNNGSSIAPTNIFMEDGMTIFAWDMKTIAIGGTLGTDDTILDRKGENSWGWTTTFGMTLADETVPAVISYIGFRESIPGKRVGCWRS